MIKPELPVMVIPRWYSGLASFSSEEVSTLMSSFPGTDIRTWASAIAGRSTLVPIISPIFISLLIMVLFSLFVVSPVGRLVSLYFKWLAYNYAFI